MKRDRIDAIDSLRGIACLVIALLWHYLNMQPKELGMPLQSIFGVFYNYGQYLVELFFMISGFVMAYCYKKKIEDGEDFLPYMAKRYKHLYPLFFVTLMYMLVFQILYYAVSGAFYVYKVSVWHLVLNLLCIQSGWFTTEQSFNGPAWCISVEIFLYILYYITTKIAKKDKNAYIIISGILFVVATVLVYRNNINDPIINQLMMRGVSCFYVGVLLAELNDWSDADRKRKMAETLFILFVIFRLALCFAQDYNFWENEGTGRMMLILVEWPILIFSSINIPWFRKILEIRPLKFLGTISMDVFLWHVPIQITIKSIDKICGLDINYGSLKVWGVYILLVLVIATVSNVISKRTRNGDYLLKGMVTIVCCAIVLSITDLTGIRFKAIMNNSLSYSDYAAIACMDSDMSVSEDFYVEKETKIQKIQFYTITWRKQFADEQMLQISIKKKDTEEIIYQVSRNMKVFNDGENYNLILDNAVELDSDMWYTITFDSNTEEGQEVMALLMVNEGDEKSGQAYINGQVTEQRISAKIWTRR